MAEAPTDLPFLTRAWFSWLCFFRVLLDGAFAQRAWDAAHRSTLGNPEGGFPKPLQTLPQAPSPSSVPSSRMPSTPPPPPPSSSATRDLSAHQLLALFQREGRLIDFLEQEIASFSDGEIGGVARVVHEGCRKALHEHATLAPVHDEQEGARVTLPEGFDPAAIKLSGNVRGAPPYEGVIRHRGWRALKLELPVAVKGHDATILAPAEVEL